jgi:hypothetical protein
MFTKEIASTMTVDTLAPQAPSTEFDTPDVVVPSSDSVAHESASTPDVPAAAPPAEEKPKKAPAKKAAATTEASAEAKEGSE